MKKINITKCSECPHKDHAGGFGSISYIPTCSAKMGRTLPYTKKASNTRIVAVGTSEIPYWCPLDNDIKSEKELINLLHEIMQDIGKHQQATHRYEENGDDLLDIQHEWFIKYIALTTGSEK